MINHIKRLVGSAIRATKRLLSYRAGRINEKILCAVIGPGAYRCSLCGRSVRNFHPLPEDYRLKLKAVGWPYGYEGAETCNANQYSCPYCEAADRTRLMALYLREWFRGLSGPVTVIDFAPAAPLTAFIRREIAGLGHPVRYRTSDLLSAEVDDRADITDMPQYATGSVDLWLCSHVLEHVTDDRKAMRELLRILKPGGRGALLVPIQLALTEIDEDPTVTDPDERWRRFGQYDHVRLYSKAGFVARLREAGFVVTELGIGHFGTRCFAEQGISPQSVLYVVARSAGEPARE